MTCFSKEKIWNPALFRKLTSRQKIKGANLRKIITRFECNKIQNHESHSFLHSWKTCWTCYKSECYTTSKRTKTGENQKVDSIWQRNRVEAHKVII